MACKCWYLVKILRKCCFCYSLRIGAILWGSIFLTWFAYLTVGAGFMMDCIFPNEYQTGNVWPEAALKTTMVFSFFGVLGSGLVCMGVINNNEYLFLPFLIFAPVWIIVHILAVTMYSFKLVIVALAVITICCLIYAWCVIWSYYVELTFSFDEDLIQMPHKR